MEYDFITDNDTFDYRTFKEQVFGSGNKPGVSDLTDEDIYRRIAVCLSDEKEYTGQCFPDLYFKTMTWPEHLRVKELVNAMVEKGHLKKELLNPKAPRKSMYIYRWTTGPASPLYGDSSDTSNNETQKPDGLQQRISKAVTTKQLNTALAVVEYIEKNGPMTKNKLRVALNRDAIVMNAVIDSLCKAGILYRLPEASQFPIYDILK